MAPQLRKRVSKDFSKHMATSKTTASKAMTSSKRKAGDDVSPDKVKKSKVVKAKAATKSTNSYAKPKSKATKKQGLELEQYDKKQDDKHQNDESGPEEQDEDYDQEQRGQEASEEVMLLLDSENEENGDESDAESQVDDAADKPLRKIPKAPKHAKPVKASGEPPGVIYIGRIPHGFYEEEMKAFFSQFGVVNKIRLSRNKKTGASKHYAFVEFAEASTAKVVANTMDNYKLYERVLKVKLVADEKIHPDLWKGCNSRFRALPWTRIAQNRVEKPKTEEKWKKVLDKESHRREQRSKALAKIAYHYEAPALSLSIPNPPLSAAPEGKSTAEEAGAIEGAALEDQDAGTEEVGLEQAEESEKPKSKQNRNKKNATTGQLKLVSTDEYSVDSAVKPIFNDVK